MYSTYFPSQREIMKMFPPVNTYCKDKESDAHCKHKKCTADSVLEHVVWVFKDKILLSPYLAIFRNSTSFVSVCKLIPDTSEDYHCGAFPSNSGQRVKWIRSIL